MRDTFKRTMGERLFLVLTMAGLLGLGNADAQEKKGEKRDPVLEAYYQANGLFNRKLYPLAEDGYRELREVIEPVADYVVRRQF